MSSKTVLILIALMFVLMCFLYIHVSGLLWPAIVAAVVILLVVFFFATISGSLCGFIGSSNDPVSGLTLSTLLIAALLMVSLGVTGSSGVTTVLGVAAVVCVSSSVAGELLQDFKVGYILGGTPAKIQKAELIAVVVASLVMYFPLALLNTAFGFGTRQLAAPQAGLMAALAQGIVGGDMPWPLVGVGIFFGIDMIMMQVRSPMLVAVGMYLPFETTFAIFVGGAFRSLGESLLGLLWAAVVALALAQQPWLQGAAGVAKRITSWQVFEHPMYVMGLVVMGLLALLMIALPLTAAGDPKEPVPPKSMM